MKKSILADVIVKKLKESSCLKPDQQALVKNTLESMVVELGIEDMVERRLARGTVQTPYRKKD
jgi:hypothetical protein